MEYQHNAPLFLHFPDEILLKILSCIPKLDLFWCAGLTCRKLFALSCDLLENTIELRERSDKDNNGKSIIDELRQAARLEEVFRRHEILECISHIIIPSYSYNCVGRFECILIIVYNYCVL